MTFDTNTILIVVAVLAVLIVGFLVMRPRRQRIETGKAEKVEDYAARRDRPYVRPREGNGVTGEVAAGHERRFGFALDRVGTFTATSRLPGSANPHPATMRLLDPDRRVVGESSTGILRIPVTQRAIEGWYDSDGRPRLWWLAVIPARR